MLSGCSMRASSALAAARACSSVVAPNGWPTNDCAACASQRLRGGWPLATGGVSGEGGVAPCAPLAAAPEPLHADNASRAPQAMGQEIRLKRMKDAP